MVDGVVENEGPVSGSVLAADEREALAAAWELAAFSFRYPAAELAQAVCSGGWAQAAQEIAHVLGLGLPKGFGEAEPPSVKERKEAEGGLGYGEGDGDAARVLTELRVEATRLFIGPPHPAVSPYEGVWRANEEGVQALLFVNPHSIAVERFMKACGLGRPEGTNEPLDHIATECELLQHLALRALDPSWGEASSLPAAGDLPGGSAESSYDLFLAEHVQAWAPGFAARVSAEARMSFYRDASAFLDALVASQRR